MNLLVFSHICFIAKVIKVPGISLTVQLWDERRTLLSQLGPFHLSEVRMRFDLSHTAEASSFSCNAAGDEVPGTFAEVVVWILVDGLLENRLPALEILPSLVDRGTSKGWISGERLEEHASQAPVVNSEVVLVALQNFRCHVIWASYNTLRIVDVPLTKGPIAFSALGSSTIFHCTTERHGVVGERFELDTHGLNLLWGKEASSKTKVSELDVPSTVNEEIFRLEITMDVTKLVQGVNAEKHFRNVESSMSVVEDPSVVEQCAEVTTWDVFLGMTLVQVSEANHKAAYHCKIDAFLILEGIEQPDEPFAVGRCEDVTFCQDVSNLIELEKQFLAHDFQGTDFARVLLLSEINLSISALSDLSENLEVAMSKSRSALSQVCPLTAQIFAKRGVVLLFFGFGWWRVACLKLVQASLTVMDVAEEIKVVI
jgi:hypothetical protein